MRLIHLLIIFLFFTNSILCQDSLENRNTISISLLSALDRTLSFTYYRKINYNIEISINPRFRVAKTKNDYDYLTGPASLLFPDPEWYYNRFSLRCGLLFRTQSFYFQNLFIEPIIQYDHGSFKNRAFLVDDQDGEMEDIVERVDRTYNSLGLIGLIDYIVDFNFLRLKIFSGLGLHTRFYNDIVIRRYLPWSNHSFAGYPKTIKYEKIKLSLHFGLELGINF